MLHVRCLVSLLTPPMCTVGWFATTRPKEEENCMHKIVKTTVAQKDTQTTQENRDLYPEVPRIVPYPLATLKSSHGLMSWTCADFF